MELLNAIAKRFNLTKKATIPLTDHEAMKGKKDAIIKQQGKVIILLEKKIISLEKEREYNMRENLIDQTLIVELFAYTTMPESKRKKLSDKVDKQKAFIRKYYGRMHPNDKYNPASIKEDEEN